MRLEFEPNVTAFPLVENELFEDVGQSAMSDFASLLKNGIAAAQSGDREHARLLLTQAADADPRSEDAWMWLASISDYPEELLAFLNHVLEINPENARAVEWLSATRSLLAKTFVQRAVAAHQENALEMVHQCLDQAIAYDSNCEMAWFWKASVSDDEAQRFDYLQKVLEINPDNREAAEERRSIENAQSQSIFAAAKAAAVAGNQDEAITLLDQFLEKDQTSAEGWILKSHLSPNMEQKIEALEKALEIEPDNSAARSGYDYFMATFGSAKAVEALEVSDDPEVSEDEVIASQPTAESIYVPVSLVASESIVDEDDVPAAPVAAIDPFESVALDAAATHETVADDIHVTAEPDESSDRETEENLSAPVTEAFVTNGYSPDHEMASHADADADVVADVIADAEADEVDAPSAYTANGYDEPVEHEVMNGYDEPVEHEVMNGYDEPGEHEVMNGYDEPGEHEVMNGYDEPVEHEVMIDDEQVEMQTAGFAETESSESMTEPSVVATLDDETDMPEMETLDAGDEHQPMDVAVADQADESPVSNDEVSADPYADEPAPAAFETAPDPFDEAADAFEAASRDAFAAVSDSVDHTPETPIESPDHAAFTADAHDPQIHITDLLDSRPVETDHETGEPDAQSTGAACPFCLSVNDSQAFECATCHAMLTLADIESLLTVRESELETIRESVTQMEADWNLREFSEVELTSLGIGHLNLNNFDSGLKYLQEASRLNPNNVILAAQVNTVAIRLDEIRHQSEIRDAKAKGKTILVVDDSPTVRKLISGKLEKSGHNVICAVDGVEALERLGESLPDLVLLDITMPRMDGYEVCKNIRLNPAAKELPVVMISGKDGFFDKVRGRMAGTTGYVTKPFGPETLMKALETYLLPDDEIVS